MDILMSLYNQVGRGTYWRALNLARSLVKFGHNVTLIAMSEDRKFRFRESEDEGVWIIESPDLLPGMLRSGWDIWDVLCRLYKLRDMDFNLVHAFECRPVAIYPALYLHRTREIPLLTDWGDWFGKGGSVEERRNPIIRNMLRPIETYYETRFRAKAQGTTVINSVLRDKALRLGVPAETILLLRNGCDYKGIKPIPKLKARVHMGIPEYVPVIGYIGSIFYRDAMLMADAFKRILATYPRALLLVAGYFNADIEGLMGQTKSIIRTGPVRFDEIGRILSVSDVCWLPLLNSGANQGRWPIKLCDYMAAGKPVVSTNVGDLGNFINQYGFGLVSRDTPEDLSHRVVELLADSQKRQQMGIRARQLSETTFSWDSLAKRLEEFYKMILPWVT